MMVCCCSLAGTAACQHCLNNPMATDVRTNITVTVDHVEAKTFGNGIDVCPVCGKPSTIGKPQTNADKIRAMKDEELAEFVLHHIDFCLHRRCNGKCISCFIEWLKKEVEE